MNKSDLIWFNGELVAWDAAQIHVLSHVVHYGTGVFEGIRCYETPRGPAIFRLKEHLERLANSSRLLHIPLPFSVEATRGATHEAAASNGLPECEDRKSVV